jgi:hypothetical protein
MVDRVQRLAELAGIGIVDRIGVLLIRTEDAPAFIQACAARNHAIVGIDGFDLNADGSMSPRNDAILDASQCLALDWAACREKTALAARNFIAAIASLEVTHLEFVLMSEGEARAAAAAQPQ